MPSTLAGQVHLSAMVRDLNALRDGPESDEYGALRPSIHAYETSMQLLTGAATLASQEGWQCALGCVSTDSEGGVRVEWVRDRRSVHLVAPKSSDANAYLYHEVGDDYATEDATPEGLARWLREID
jgi:hypothetical protein